MKLAYCLRCRDGFFLSYEMKQCPCGNTKGRYDKNGETAVLTDNDSTISIAIGNGSLMEAIQDMRNLQAHKPEAHRKQYQEDARIWYAWVRPNTGTGNPHTMPLKEE